MSEQQNFNISLCFPTPILSTVDEQLAEKMLPMVKKYLSDETITTKEVLGYKSTFDKRGTGFSKIAHLEEIVNFESYICDIGVKFLKKMGYKVNYDIQAQIFVSEMYEGDYHEIHTHQNSLLSGVFYLQTPENCSPIIFYDPKPKRLFIKQDVEEENEITSGTLFLSPKKGLILMWESWLEHSVQKNPKISEGRIAIVFNITTK